MQDVYKNIDEHNPGKKRKTLIVFDYIIADLINNKSKFKSGWTIELLEAENETFLLFLSLNNILMFQKVLGQIILTFSL